MENRVRLGLKKLLNIAHDDTGQGRRVANFLLAWWNAEAHGGVDIAEPVCRGSRGVQGHGHRVHLARARGRRLPDRLSRRDRRDHRELATGAGVKRTEVMIGSVGPGRRRVPLCPGEFDEAALDLGKQRRRQWPEVTAVAVDRPNVGTRPGKTVAFGKQDPGALVIEPEPPFGCRRNLDRLVGAGRRRMGDRQHTHDWRAVLKRGDQRQHQAWPIFVALFATFEILPVPEIRIAEDVADLDFSRQHSCPSAVRR